ncbi:MAG: PKD domain-containing protein [Bacteroidota bacterium]
MKRHYLLLLLLLSLSYGAWAQPSIEFIENKGQWGDWFKYKAITAGGPVFLENDGFRYILCDEQNVAKMDSFHHGLLAKKPIMKFHVYKMSFEGAQAPQIVGSKQQKNYYNYFLGNDPEKWKSDIHPYLAIDYKNLYRGIDMHLSSESGSMVYEFVVQPNADAGQVKLNFKGPDNMSIKNGDLVINTSVGKVMELKPYAYQYINDEKVEIACRYVLKNNRLTFAMGKYDHSQTLIIDPTIAFWCSFTGSTADNWGFTATYDNTGNFYMGGIVNNLPGGTFPVSPGAYQSTFAGGQGTDAIQYASDIGIMKLSPDGTSRVYATYLGGANNERPHSLIVDPAGNLLIAGRTLSPNYPVTGGAFQTVKNGGWDIIVTKLNAAGTGLLASTFIGGSADDGVNFDSTEIFYGHLKYNYGDDARSEVQIDNTGNVYVTSSTWSTNFPTTATAIATTLSGMQDGVIFKFNPSLSSLMWSTYLSGVGDEAGYVLAFNSSQSSVYVAGGTSSTNFPATPGAWQSTYQGDSADGYILKFRNSPPYNVQRGTFVGTSRFDQVYGIQLDAANNVYVMGQSLGGTFPVTAGVYSNPSSSQFIMKMDSNLTNNLISTVYGSGDPLHTNISPVAFLVDTCNNIYISGWGGNIMGSMAPGLAHSGTTTGMAVTSDAHDSSTDGFDFYFMVLGPGMTTLRYATFYGRDAPGFSGEHVDGGTSRFDKKGIIYQAICANCGGSGTPPFPTTAGVWAPANGCAYNCNEAALKIAFNIGPVETNVTAGPATSGCAPLTVNFFNATTNGLTYVWNFGDGSAPVTTFAATHTFTAGGTFTVTLAAANSSACFTTNDTAEIIIVVDTNKIRPDFNYTITDSCGPFIATFTNTSTTNITTSTPTYTWHFGDGGTFSGTTPGAHNYSDTGTYTVMLIMAQTGACKTPDTIKKQIHISYLRVKAGFDMPDSVCLGSGVNPVGSTSNATTITWTFTDGQSTTPITPPINFTAAGTYTVTQIAINPGACNGADSVKHVIKVLPAPTADFSFSPMGPIANVPTTFTNLSTNAVRYSWDFGDATKSTEINPVHQYNKTGTYTACLTAFNAYNCPAVVCKEVPSEVVPIIGLPTGFSPNGDGQNDILYVRGAAIKTLDLKIYNRWGQLVFQTTSQTIGWDGTFNGEPQPIEAYGYVLNVSFIDGTAKLMKGNITLLR